VPGHRDPQPPPEPEPTLEWPERPEGAQEGDVRNEDTRAARRRVALVIGAALVLFIALLVAISAMVGGPDKASAFTAGEYRAFDTLGRGDPSGGSGDPATDMRDSCRRAHGLTARLRRVCFTQADGLGAALAADACNRRGFPGHDTPCLRRTLPDVARTAGAAGSAAGALVDSLGSGACQDQWAAEEAREARVAGTASRLDDQLGHPSAAGIEDALRAYDGAVQEEFSVSVDLRACKPSRASPVPVPGREGGALRGWSPRRALTRRRRSVTRRRRAASTAG
jgi:hypothetical protein